LGGHCGFPISHYLLSVFWEFVMLKLSILLSSVTVVALPLAMASTAMASFSGVGTISGSLISSGANAGDYNYSIDLTNTGTQSIDFLWFAWTPGQDHLYSTPISASAPTGWSTTILPAGGGSGASIQFHSSTMSIAAGSSLDFSFITADSPSLVYSNSSYWFPGKPVGTSVLYNGGAFSTPSDTIVVTPTPEPAASGLLAIGSLVGLTLASRARRRQLV